MRTVLIIGAGFSGVACAVQLLRHAGSEALRVRLLNRSGRLARGLAYGTQSPQHMLNVPACKMSVMPDEPEHFLHYAQRRDSRVQVDSFVARSVYGDYLEWALQQAIDNAPPHATLDCIGGAAASLHARAGGGMVAELEDGRTIAADKVILAFGHFPGNDPPVADMSFYGSRRYQRDPWNAQQLDAIPPAEPVLLLGSGLTAVDLALSLLRRNPARMVYAVSRHGLLPQPYAAPSAQLASTALLRGESATVRRALRAFLMQVEALEAAGHHWQDAMRALRNDTAAIWQSWPVHERQRFLRHVQPYWVTHRHQLAPTAQEQVAAALARGSLRVMAARVQAYREESEFVEVRLRPRGGGAGMALRAAHVVNCTGASTSPRRSGSALVQQLLADGMLRTDALGLGIDTAPDCVVCNAAGEPQQDLFYIGPWLKAGYWEATAVPELRAFGDRISAAVLRSAT